MSREVGAGLRVIVHDRVAVDVQYVGATLVEHADRPSVAQPAAVLPRAFW